MPIIRCPHHDRVVGGHVCLHLLDEKDASYAQRFAGSGLTYDLICWNCHEEADKSDVALADVCIECIQSIAFPLIGAGSGGFNHERAKAIMEDELGKMDFPMEVRLVVFSKSSKDPQVSALDAPVWKDANDPCNVHSRHIVISKCAIAAAQAA